VGTKRLRVPTNVCSWWKSGHAADITAKTDFDPHVWSGRALQEDFSEFEGCGGLASMYPAFDWSLCAPGHHGYQRACDLINAGELIGERDGKDVVMQSRTLVTHMAAHSAPNALAPPSPTPPRPPGRTGRADSDCPVLICCRGLFGLQSRFVSVPAQATRRSRDPSKTCLPFRLRPPSHSR
jgi:hypothetical protein